MDPRIKALGDQIGRAPTLQSARWILAPWLFQKCFLSFFHKNYRNIYGFLLLVGGWRIQVLQLILRADPTLAQFVLNSDKKMRWRHYIWRRTPDAEWGHSVIHFDKEWALMVKHCLLRGEVLMSEKNIHRILYNWTAENDENLPRFPHLVNLFVAMHPLTWETRLQFYVERHPRAEVYLNMCVTPLPLSRLVEYAYTLDYFNKILAIQEEFGLNRPQYLAALLKKYATLGAIKRSKRWWRRSYIDQYKRLISQIRAEIERGTSLRDANHNHKLFLHAILGDTVYGERNITKLLLEKNLRPSPHEQQQILNHFIRAK